MIWIWIIVVILLSVVELLTINLTTIWFVISGFLTILLSFFIKNFFIQFGFFAVLGLILFITTRPILKKILKQKNVKTKKINNK